jgi:capsular exopolysaccharide synthesis family protein
MEIKKYIDILWRRKWIILLTLVVAATVVAVGTKMTTPVYQATAILRIAVSAGGPLSYSDYQYADQLMNTYVEMATRRPVLEELMKRLMLSRPPAVKAEIIPGTELINLTVEDTNPKRAAEAANALADILIAQGNQLYVGGGKRLSEVLSEQLTQIESDLDENRTQYEKLLVQTPAAPDEIETTKQALQLKQSNYATLLAQYQQARFREEIQGSMITVFESATEPGAPSKPRIMLNILLGFVVGLAGGLGLAFLFENIDTVLYKTDDIEAVTQLTALGMIPEASKEQLFIFQDIYSPLAEAFRNLATHVQQLDQAKAGQRKVLLVLGAEPDQGKSLIISQLALCLAEAGRKVVVVDCDLRMPNLHRLFMLPNKCGLTDILERGTSLEKALQKSIYSEYPDVDMLSSGPLPNYPTKLLASPEMTEVIHHLAQRYDYVLLDTPPMLGIADVTALLQKVDGFLWVVRRAHAKRDAVEAARKFLAGFAEKSVGLVVNQADHGGHYGHYGYQRRASIPTPSPEDKVLAVPRTTL